MAYVYLTAPWKRIGFLRGLLTLIATKRKQTYSTVIVYVWGGSGGVPLFLIKQHTFYYHASYTESIWVCYERKFYSNIDISTPRSPLRKFCWDEMIKQMKKTVLVHEKCILGRNWKICHSSSPRKKKYKEQLLAFIFIKTIA